MRMTTRPETPNARRKTLATSAATPAITRTQHGYAIDFEDDRQSVAIELTKDEAERIASGLSARMTGG